MHGSNTLVIIIEVIVLVVVSAICSGLNIAVMALDERDLVRKAKLGNKTARRVLPLRQDIHLTLASILLTNVAMVSATSLVLERRFNGWIAGIASTLLIVVFGEIMPQALFGRDPLGWAGRFSGFLIGMRIITFPVSRPLQLLLDKLFPRESARLQTRHELGLLITEHLSDETSELDDDEVEIMRGALSLSEKRVRDIMTPLQLTYWLTPDTVLDGEKIDEIKLRGFSRIPIFDRQLTKCYGLLLMKDLVDIDFDEQIYRVDDLPLFPAPLVGERTALDTMFRKFIATGIHLIPLERDDKIIGIVTIEDLIEEIVGHEIEDETDRRNKLQSA